MQYACSFTLSIITQISIWTMSRKAVGKESVLPVMLGLKLKLTNFVATRNQWKSWCTARNLCFNKSFKRNSTISTGFPNLGV